MPRQLSTFALEPEVLHRSLIDGNVRRHPESHYLDFLVDLQPLTQRLQATGNQVTALNRAWLDSVPTAVEELLGLRPAAGLAAGRVALLVCGECGDLGCGAVTASLSLGPTSVSWSDFLWENYHSEPAAVADAPGPIVFSRSDYEAALRGAYQVLATLPYDQLAHHGRKFRWPWQWGWRLDGPKDSKP